MAKKKKRAAAKPAAKQQAAKPAPEAKAAAPKRARKRFTPKQRANILAEANAKGLTGKQVAKQYGIAMVTYYLWRKQAGLKGRPGRKPAGGVPRAELAGKLRREVQAQIQALLPKIVKDEVQQYLKRALR